MSLRIDPDIPAALRKRAEAIRAETADIARYQAGVSTGFLLAASLMLASEFEKLADEIGPYAVSP